MAVVLALASAVAYGLADFVGGLTSRRVGLSWPVAVAALLSGGLLTGCLALVLPGTPSAADLAWSLLAGVANGLGTAFLYRGLAGGSMGVVAPVSGVGAALVPLAVALITGERPGVLVWIGVLAALPGIWLVSREPTHPSATPRGGTGLVDGVVAGLGFGTLFAALAQIPEGAGLLPLALNQLLAAGVVAVVATALGHAWLPRSPKVAWGAGGGALGALATGLFLTATHGGYLSVVSVIAALYPAFTVLLAVAVLHERIHRSQGVGLALCALAVALVAGG